MGRRIAGGEVKYVSNHISDDVHRVDRGEAEVSWSTPDRMTGEGEVEAGRRSAGRRENARAAPSQGPGQGGGR